jgi:hypothetical protein
MPFVALWSGAAPGSCFSEVRASDIFLLPFLCKPRNDERKSRRIPYLRIVDCFRVVDCYVFLRVRDYLFGWNFFSINSRHAACLFEHVGGFF